MLLLLLPGLGLLFFVTSCFLRLWSNFRAAQKLDLPIVIAPFTWQDPPWQLLGPHVSFLHHLPFGLGHWVQYRSLGWSLKDRHHMHTKLGPAFVIVSTRHNEIILADGPASEEVYSKWKQWIKSEEMYSIFNVFGKNVNSVNGKDWQRHRKITGPAFKEATNKMVWDEASKQAAAMSGRWASTAEVTMDSFLTDACTLAFNVLMAAGFGKEFELDTEFHRIGSGHTMSYGSSLRTILTNIQLAIMLSAFQVPQLILPGKPRHLKAAIREFKQYMTEKIVQEREASKHGNKSGGSLVGALVHANEVAKQEEEGNSMALSDSELYGNMFVFNLGGFDTTASALTYGLPLLAIHPEVQEWAALEAREVLGDVANPAYEETFPRMPRLMAVMHEILRLWGSVQTLPRYTGSSAQILRIKHRAYTVPANTYVTPNITAMHSDPSTWGPDALDWRPSRWIKLSPTGQEYFAGPPEGAMFLPWITGARVCPGKKFSQVEFVSALAVFLRDYKIRPARRGSETALQARQRLDEVVRDSIIVLSPKMRRPKDAGLVWVRRAAT